MCLFGFQQLTFSGKEPYINIYVGIPEEIAFSEYRKTLLHNILIWSSVVVMIIGLAYFFSINYKFQVK